MQPNRADVMTADSGFVATCVWRCRRGGLYDCGAVVRHAELASSLGVQRGDGGRARPSVPPIRPPRELQVQGLVQGQHDRKPPTSHLHKRSQRGRVRPSGANEGQLGLHKTTHTMKRCVPKTCNISHVKVVESFSHSHWLRNTLQQW